MSRAHFKQALSLFLAALMVQPPQMQAGSAAVLGSINTYGEVRVGQSAAPSQATLFAGDLVDTRSGNAVVQYQQGARVLLAKASTAVFSPNAVELKQGQMSFRSVSGDDVVFQASSLRLEPVTEKASADVVVSGGKASISVKEGSVRAVDPTGIRLAEIPAGKTQLFAMAVPPAATAAAPAPATPASASASAAAPPLPSALAAVWVALSVGAATMATLVTSAVTDNDDEVEERAAASPIQP